MDAAFTMQPRCPKPFAVFVLGVLGDAKAKIAINGDRCIHIGTKAVEMINTKRLYPCIKAVILMDRSEAIHFVIKFNRNTHIIRGQKLSALVRPLHLCFGLSFGFEIGFGAVKVDVIKSFKPQNVNRSGRN